MAKYLHNNKSHDVHIGGKIRLSEIKNAIRAEKINNAVGSDLISSEIFKRNADWWIINFPFISTRGIFIISPNPGNTEILPLFANPETWTAWIIIGILPPHRNRLQAMGNIMSNGVTPILNIRTNDQQCAYKRPNLQWGFYATSEINY